MTTRPDVSTELVPLADRLRVMQIVRVCLAALAVAHVAATPATWSVDVRSVAALAGAYCGLTLLGYVVWHLWSGRGITLFGAMLIVDGIFLAGLAALSGGVGSAAGYLVLPHCMMVALLASYRSAAKIALWHSLLATTVYYAGDAGLLPHTGVAGATGRAGGTMIQLVSFTVLTWFAALGTASFAAMNERELRRRKVDLEDLARMAAALETVSTSEAVGRILSAALTDAYGFGAVAVLVVEGDGLVALTGPVPDGAPPGGVDEVVRAAWAAHATQLVNRLDAEHDRHLSAVFGRRQNLLVTPLYADGRPVGAVVAEHGLRRGSRIERRVVSMVERFCAHASLALRNAWLFEELQQVAATDALTGVANRRTFEQTLERELKRAARAGTGVALLMVDVDRFKNLNDTFGHRTGDQVLRSVASELVRQCREYDLVSRYGGEEFAVVLPGCAEADAVSMAERMRLAISALDDGPHVTASIGVASSHAGVIDAESLVRASDSALYEAKHHGRDRVVRFGAPSVVSSGDGP